MGFRNFLILSLILPFCVKSVAQPQQLNVNVYSGQKEIKATESVVLGDGFNAPAGSNVRVYIVKPFFVHPTTTKNYTVLSTALKAGSKDADDLNSRDAVDVNRVIGYYDGQGRILQSVLLQGNPQKKDIVIPHRYDRFGTEPRQYLPYVATAGDGAFRNNAINEQQAYYLAPPTGVANIVGAFSATKFELAPGGKLKEQGFPGLQWQLHDYDFSYSDNSAVIEYSYNSIGPSNRGSYDPDRAVAKYSAIVNLDGSYSLTRLNGNEYYGGSRLFVKVNKDENTHSILGSAEEYSDKEGKLILKRTYNETDQGIDVLSTYYVYDLYGNLCFVLPPLADPDNNNAITADILNNVCFQYRYDSRNRLIEKKIPGKSWEFMVYNDLDQLVMTQDGIQRNKSPQEWSFVKYDGLGREVIKGISSEPGTAADNSLNSPSRSLRASMQLSVDNSNVLSEKRNSSVTGYSNFALPINNIISYLIINYYDNYDIPGLPATYNHAGLYTKKSDGLLTATKRAVLNNTSHLLWSAHYYDDKGNQVKTFMQHYKDGLVNDGNYDEISNTYDFTGNLTNSIRSHRVAAIERLLVQNRYVFDHFGRLVDEFQKMNNDGEVLLSRNEYSPIGQLHKKMLHSENEGASFLHTTTYSYNSRGWMEKSIGDLFKLELLYDNPNEGYHQYNGNLSGIKWGANLENTWDYYYDNLNRLKRGGVYETQFGEILTYDKGGNIKTLKRDGNLISYDYDPKSNQLKKVTGNGVQNQNYQYDLNGNTILDGSKGNLIIGYNLLNLPKDISGDNFDITYNYDVTGQKLSKASTATGFKEYIGGIHYTNGAIEFVATAEGRAIRRSDDTYIYQYNLIDHQGNVRVTLDKDPITLQARRLQEDYYYPFGMRMSVSPVSLDNHYLYNGKELQDELGQLDYGSRFYDPVIGRWNVMDPHAESYMGTSPYAYVLNSPINLIDPSGMDPMGWILPTWDDADPYWDPDINSPDEFKTSGVSGKYLGQNGYGIDNLSGIGVYYNDDGTISPRTQSLEGITATASRVSPSMAMQALDIGSDLMPVVGSGKDIYKGVRDGNLLQLGIGVGGLVLDVATLGAGSLLKGGLKVGIKGLAEVGAKEFAEQAAKEFVEQAAKEGVQYTKSSLSLGRQMHTGYKAGLADGVTTFKEFTGIKGIRPDFVDFGTKTIYELKPFNPRSIQLGTKQLNNYKSIFEREYPGTIWKTVLDRY